MTLSPREIEQTLNVLQRIADDPALIDDHDRFKSLIAKIYKRGKKQHKLKKRSEKRVETQALVETTAIVQAQLKHCSLAEKSTALSQMAFRNIPQAKT
ncbi:MAG: hypothetical protein SWJ54_16135, partial [Cyanobacteriota bacterium]|nr:hypothetical protein [Cyanobacteriota bacterium]